MAIDSTSRNGEVRRDPSELVVRVYGDLRKLAHRYVGAIGNHHTLHPTDVVHESFVKLSRSGMSVDTTRAGFMRLAAKAMRDVLVDHARRRSTQKRGGELRRVPLDVEWIEQGDPPTSVSVLELNDAVEQLERDHPRQGRVAELRLFAGLGQGEIARTLGIRLREVADDWRFASAWLGRRLTAGGMRRDGS